MKQVVLIPLAVVGLAVLTILGLLSTQTWDPEWNPFEPGTAEQGIVETAIENLFSLDSLSYNVLLKIDGFGGDSSKETELVGSVGLNLRGALDASDKDNRRTKTIIDIAFSSADIDVIAGLEIRGIDGNIYVQITSLPSFIYMLLSPDILEAVENKWLVIDKEKLSELSRKAEDDLLDEQNKQLLADLEGVVKGKELFEIKKDLGREKVDDVLANHYLVSVNKEAVKQIISEYAEISKKYLGEAEQRQIESALTEMPSSVDEIWASINGVEMDVWIDEAGSKSYLKKLKFDKEIKSGDLPLDSEAGGSAKIMFDLVFSGFNQPVEIEAPADAVNIEEIFGPLLEDLSDDLSESLPFNDLQE